MNGSGLVRLLLALRPHRYRASGTSERWVHLWPPFSATNSVKFGQILLSS